MNTRFTLKIAMVFAAMFFMLTDSMSTENRNENELEITTDKTWLLKDFNGNGRSINDYTGNGKWLVAMVWASDCHICDKEVGNYVLWYERHKNINATVLGVSIDGWKNKSNALAFVDRHKITFPNLIASPAIVSNLIERLTGTPLYGTPTFLVFSPEGKLLAVQTGAVPTTLIDDFIQKNSTKTN